MGFNYAKGTIWESSSIFSTKYQPTKEKINFLWGKKKRKQFTYKEDENNTQILLVNLSTSDYSYSLSWFWGVRAMCCILCIVWNQKKNYNWFNARSRKLKQGAITLVARAQARKLSDLRDNGVACSKTNIAWNAWQSDWVWRIHPLISTLREKLRHDYWFWSYLCQTLLWLTLELGSLLWRSLLGLTVFATFEWHLNPSAPRQQLDHLWQILLSN